MTPRQDNTYWEDRGWVAEVVENEDGGGWALSMTRDGDDLPVLVVPWVMGRNKKDPKPLNARDFATQLKAAKDFLHRSQQQVRTAHRRSFDVSDGAGGTTRVVFDVVPDAFEPEGRLTAFDALGAQVAEQSVGAGHRLTRAGAQAWVNGGFGPVADEGGGW